MPKTAKSATKKTVTKSKKSISIKLKPVKEVKKILLMKRKLKHQLKFQRIIFQKIQKNICVKNTYLFLK